MRKCVPWSLRKTTELGLGLAIAGALTGAGCGGAKTEPATRPEPPAVSVQTADVKALPMPNQLPLTGQLVANQQSEVAANGVGKVIRTLVDRGSLVNAGATLIQLDTKSAQLSQAEAHANVQNAEASEELARTLCKRTDDLLARGAISKEEWERTSSQCRTSTAMLDAARARASLAEKTLSDATVRAPFAGMVGQRYVSVGEYVQPATRVVTLVELDPLRLQLTVPEADVGQIKEGQEVRFFVDAFPNRPFVGTIKYIDPTLRAATRDLVAEAVVKNADHDLKPGMFASAFVTLPDQTLPTVPKEALLAEGGSTHLFAVVNGHLEERIVQPGAERDGRVAILEGVKPDEKVVSAITEAVKDGVPVR